MAALQTLLCIIFALTQAFASADHDYEHKLNIGPRYRLPETLLPSHYDLTLTIDSLDSTSYDGFLLLYFYVTITGSTVNEIYLHLDPDFVVITWAYLNNLKECIVGNPSEGNIVLLNCSMAVDQLENCLYIYFTGKFSTEDGYGLVKTSISDQGVERMLIKSNFKPTYARRAFPCFDEPYLKAKFSLKISYPEEYTVISTSPVQQESSLNGTKVTQFKITPTIPTYLFSIFLSTLTEASLSSVGSYDVTLLTRSEVSNVSSLVVGNYSSTIIEQLGDYIGKPYSSVGNIKSYLVALPNYFSDAMGGFGLYTYGESDLLDEGEITAARVKQNIITTLAYKLSNAWFGGSVSINWWSDVWANEAVATYLKYIIPDQINDEMELPNQFVVEVIQKALQYDAMPFVQPLSSSEADVNLSRDIEGKLDTFSYLKGASFLHMMQCVAGGAENLKSALQYHWYQRQNSHTSGQDILRDLIEYQGKEEEYYPLLERWILSPGFPLLTAKLLEYGGVYEVTELSQKRFLYPMENSSVSDNFKWDIPLTVTSQSDRNYSNPLDHFYGPHLDLVYINPGNFWIMFNLEAASFYRVNYDELSWSRIIGSLKNEERTIIHVLNRAQLVDDIFNIARIGDVTYALAFELADFLVDETEYYPWYSALNAFSYLLGKLEDSEAETMLISYILGLMDNQVHIPSDVLPTAGLSHIEILHRVMMLSWACKLGHFGCLAYAATKFEDFKEDQSSLDDHNFREVIFCYGLRHSENTLEDWVFLWNLFLNSPSVHEKEDVLNALGCVEDKLLMTSYLQRIITSNSGITKRDALVVFKAVLSSSIGIDAAVDFLQNNFDYIATYYNGVDLLAELVYALAEKLLTDAHVDWVKDVVSSAVLDDYDDVRSKAIVLVSVNNYWRNHFQDDVKNVLSAATKLKGNSRGTIPEASEEK